MEYNSAALNRNNDLSECLEQLPLARAYVPFQNVTKIFPCGEGLQNGTIFSNLNKPYKKQDRNYRPSRSC